MSMAKIDIEKLNIRKPDYEIPPEYQVLNIFSHSPIHKSVFILGKRYEKNEWAIFHFDGISEEPTMIETFYELENLTPTLNTKV